LSLLGARLAERGSEFRVIFEALESIAGEAEEISQIRRRAATEAPDETIVRMDDIWEEEAISFMGAADSCKIQAAAVSPVTITPRDQFHAIKGGNQLQNRSF
jgi:nitrate reductase molybdenum cofactor assembly chaperone NarJ/NarW